MGLVELTQILLRVQALARRLAANEVDANKPSGHQQSFPLVPNDTLTMHFVQWEEHILEHFGRSTLWWKASHKAFNPTSSPSPPPVPSFSGWAWIKSHCLLNHSKASLSTKSSHVAQAFSSAAANKRQTHVSPQRDDKAHFSSSTPRKAAPQNLSGQGGEEALEKVPCALIRGDHAVRVRQRGADSRARLD